MRQIKLFQDSEFKLVGARDMDPREVLPGAPTSIVDRETAEDPSISDITRVSDEAATVVYIEGYSSVFLNPDGTRLEDRDGESVSIALLDIENYKKNPILVYNHDWGDVSGKITHIEKTEKGLFVKAEVHKFTGREQVFESVQKGILKTFSIGFVPKTFTYIEEDDVFEISSAELVEISLAPVPSNQDAIFTATSQKSLTVNKELVKTQNNMTCDELTGICSMTKKIKGKDMNVDTKDAEKAAKEAEEKAAKEAEEKAVKEAEEKAVKEAEEKAVAAQPSKADLSVEDIADAITQANTLAAEKLAQKEAEEKATKEAEEKATQDAKEQRVTDSMEYIREQKELIQNTEPGDIDTDALGDLYELLSDTVELIEGKVTEAFAE